MGGTDRGKKRANFAVVRQTKMPAVLTENLFIDRKKDANKLKDSNFLNKLVRGHERGIAKCLGLKKKGKSSKSSPSKPSKSKSDRVNARIESKVDGLRFYSKPSWEDKDVMGHANKGDGFPTMVAKLKVGNTVTLKKTAKILLQVNQY